MVRLDAGCCANRGWPKRRVRPGHRGVNARSEMLFASFQQLEATDRPTAAPAGPRPAALTASSSTRRTGWRRREPRLAWLRIQRTKPRHVTSPRPDAGARGPTARASPSPAIHQGDNDVSIMRALALLPELLSPTRTPTARAGVPQRAPISNNMIISTPRARPDRIPAPIRVLQQPEVGSGARHHSDPAARARGLPQLKPTPVRLPRPPRPGAAQQTRGRVSPSSACSTHCKDQPSCTLRAPCAQPDRGPGGAVGPCRPSSWTGCTKVPIAPAPVRRTASRDSL